MWRSMREFLMTTTNLCALVPSPAFVAQQMLQREALLRVQAEQRARTERLRQRLILPGQRGFVPPVSVK